MFGTDRKPFCLSLMSQEVKNKITVYISIFNLNLGGLFKGSFWSGRGVKTPCLKLVKIMLESWNLVSNYKHIFSFRKYSFCYKYLFNFADVSIFFLKNQYVLSKIVPLLKAIVWKLYLRTFSSVFIFCKVKVSY